MSPHALFRTVIVFSLLFEACGSLLDIAAPSLLPEVLASSYENYLMELTQPAGFAIALIVGAVGIVGMIGMLFLRRWGRSLTLWSTIASVAAFAVGEPTILSGPAYALHFAGTTLWGVALSMAYWYGPVVARFEGES